RGAVHGLAPGSLLFPIGGRADRSDAYMHHTAVQEMHRSFVATLLRMTSSLGVSGELIHCACALSVVAVAGPRSARPASTCVGWPLRTANLPLTTTSSKPC